MDNTSDNLSTENYNNKTESESFDGPRRKCRNGRGRRQKQVSNGCYFRYAHVFGGVRKHISSRGRYKLAGDIEIIP